MTKVVIKIGIDQIAEIEGHHSEVEVSMNRTIGEDNDMLIIIEMILGETIFEKCEIIEVNISEVDIEITITEMTTLEEVEVGVGKDNTQVIIEGMTEIVVVGQDQVQEPVIIEIASDVLSVANMIILLKTVQNHKRPEQIQQMYNLDEEQTTLKVLATDTYYNLNRTNSDDTIVDHLNL